MTRKANTTYTMDCIRGPSLVVGSGARVGDGRLSVRGKINWTKTRKMLEYAIKSAEGGNFMSINILVQPESIPSSQESEET
jgi:hypothetical protein